MDLVLTPGEIAQSLFRLGTSLAASSMGVPSGKWDSLSLESQQPWLYLASKGSFLLERLEGAPVRDVARQVFVLFGHGDYSDEAFDHLAPQMQLMWEAIARHLHVLIDCEDLPSLEDSERMWFEWYQKKCDALPRQLLLVGANG
jgi:hypothetical protein